MQSKLILFFLPGILACGLIPPQGEGDADLLTLLAAGAAATAGDASAGAGSGGEAGLTAITYAGSPFVFTTGSAIARQTPGVSSAGAAIHSCTASPPLPSGLNLGSDCAIEGTATVDANAAAHTITANNGVVSTVVQVASCAPDSKMIFVSAEMYNGNMGGAGGADTRCNAAINRPDLTKTYKALISGGSATLVGGLNYCYISNPQKYYWSGTTAHRCSNWASNDGGLYSYLFHRATGVVLLGWCDTHHALQCVEQ